MDVAIPSNSNITKKEYEKLEKYQELKDKLENMWGVKATVVPTLIGVLGAATLVNKFYFMLFVNFILLYIKLHERVALKDKVADVVPICL